MCCLPSHERSHGQWYSMLIPSVSGKSLTAHAPTQLIGHERIFSEQCPVRRPGVAEILFLVHQVVCTNGLKLQFNVNDMWLVSVAQHSGTHRGSV